MTTFAANRLRKKFSVPPVGSRPAQKVEDVNHRKHRRFSGPIPTASSGGVLHPELPTMNQHSIMKIAMTLETDG